MIFYWNHQFHLLVFSPTDFESHNRTCSLPYSDTGYFYVVFLVPFILFVDWHQHTHTDTLYCTIYTYTYWMCGMSCLFGSFLSLNATFFRVLLQLAPKQSEHDAIRRSNIDAFRMRSCKQTGKKRGWYDRRWISNKILVKYRILLFLFMDVLIYFAVWQVMNSRQTVDLHLSSNAFDSGFSLCLSKRNDSYGFIQLISESSWPKNDGFIAMEDDQNLTKPEMEEAFN